MGGLTGHPWAYPALEIVHICGIALMLGNLVLLELRVFGRGAALPVADLARLSLGVAAIGFAIAAASGLTMFATNALELISNRAFQIKMALLMAAGCNAAVFHTRGSLTKLDTVARWQMVLSTAIWVAIVSCGRWIAYA